MANVRQIEVDFASIEDNILDDLGYREYTITVGSDTITPKPEVKHMPLESFTDGQLRKFIDNLGGQGNPVSYYKLLISRAVDEAIIRQYNYWVLTRGSYSAQCLPVQIKVSDSRYEVLLGVIKQAS